MDYSPISHQYWNIKLPDNNNPSRSKEEKQIFTRVVSAPAGPAGTSNGGGGNEVYFLCYIENPNNPGEMVPFQKGKVTINSPNKSTKIWLYDDKNQIENSGIWNRQEQGIQFSDGTFWYPMRTSSLPTTQLPTQNISSSTGGTNNVAAVSAVHGGTQYQEPTTIQQPPRQQQQTQPSTLPLTSSEINSITPSYPLTIVSPPQQPSTSVVATTSAVTTPDTSVSRNCPTCPKPVICPPNKPCTENNKFWMWIAILLALALIALSGYVISLKRKQEEEEKTHGLSSSKTKTAAHQSTKFRKDDVVRKCATRREVDTSGPFYRPS